MTVLSIECKKCPPNTNKSKIRESYQRLFKLKREIITRTYISYNKKKRKRKPEIKKRNQEAFFFQRRTKEGFKVSYVILLSSQILTNIPFVRIHKLFDLESRKKNVNATLSKNL